MKTDMKFSRTSIFAMLAGVVFMLFLSACGTRHSSTTSRGKYSTSRPEHVKMTASMAQPTRLLLSEADSWIGTAYRYGGEDKRGVDCSGLVMNVYNRALGIKLPRNSAKQQEFCTGVSRNELSPGDLVFFSNNSGRINHVGMYIGAGNMIHASSSRGVIISSLSEKYFMDRFHSAGRVDQYFAMLRKAANPDVRSVPSPDRPIPSSSELQASVDTRTSVKSGVMRGVEVSQDVKAVHFAPAQVPPVTAAAMEEARRKVLDEVVEQKADSILSSFFE